MEVAVTYFQAGQPIATLSTMEPLCLTSVAPFMY